MNIIQGRFARNGPFLCGYLIPHNWWPYLVYHQTQRALLIETVCIKYKLLLNLY